MTFKQFNRIIEIRTKLISISSFFCGSTFAAVQTGSWSWVRFFLMGTAVLAVDMGTTGFNSFFDFINGTDTKQYNLEHDKVLVHEGVSPKTALIISVSLFAAACVLGIVLAWMTSWYILLAGAVSMAVGFAYTGGPLPISRTPLGELFAGGFLGTLLFSLSYYIQALQLSIQVIAASIPFLMLIAMILTVNNTCDRKADAASGRRTLSILAGLQKSRIILAVQGLSAYGIFFVLIITGIYPFYVLPFSVLSLPFALREFLMMDARGYSLETKGASMGSVSKIFLLFSTAVLLGFVLEILA